MLKHSRELPVNESLLITSLLLITDLYFQEKVTDYLVIVALESHPGPCSHCVRSRGSPLHQSSACHTMPSGSSKTIQRKRVDAQEGTK